MFNQENVNVAMQQFNYTCKTFTTVMAIKHQLSYSLFSSGNITSDKGIRNLILILEYLETLASILQDIQVCTCTLNICVAIDVSASASHVMLCHFATTGNLRMQALHSFQFRSVQENILEPC